MWLAVALTGCVLHSTVVDEPQGSIDLTWTVGSKGCEGSGVTDVSVQVGKVESTFACDDGEAQIDAAPGPVRVDVTGLDADGHPRYSGSTTVAVSSDESVDAHVVLSAMRASANVTWYFENGRLCSSNDVTDVTASLFDDQDYLVDEQSASCEDGELAFDDLEAGAYSAVVTGDDGSGVPMFQGDAAITLDKGDRVEVEIELQAL